MQSRRIAVVLLLPLVAAASETVISDTGMAYMAAALAVGLSTIAGGSP